MNLFQPGVFQPDVFQQEVGEGVTVTIHQTLAFTQRMELRPKRGSGRGRRERPEAVRIVIHQRVPLRQHLLIRNNDDAFALGLAEFLDDLEEMV